MKKTVAYIVVGWNNRDILEECFASIDEQTYKHRKIYFVDNDSKDDSVKMVAAKFPHIIILAQDENTGFAKGNNTGIAKALEDDSVGYCMLLNSDARLDPEWTSRVVALDQRKPRGALYQGTTLDYYDHGVIDSTHIFISRNGQGTQGNWRKPFAYDEGSKRVFGVNAAACMITRTFLEAQPFDQVFDETMFMYLEDVDLAARATVMGWNNYLVRGATAYHMGSVSSSKKDPSFSLYMTFRNNTALLVKNLPLKIMVRVLPSLIRGDIDTFRALRRQGKKKAAWKVLQGRVYGTFRSIVFLKKRRTMRRLSRITTQELWRLMGKGY